MTLNFLIRIMSMNVLRTSQNISNVLKIFININILMFTVLKEYVLVTHPSLLFRVCYILIKLYTETPHL